MSKLALLGGPPQVDGSLAPYETIGEEEVAAATRVVRSGRLSGFVGAWCEEFRGGPEVRGLEEEWAERFRARHAVTVNSNTSGLVAAMGAVGVGPGDEVIVPPYSMSATAIAPLAYGGIPVFADIEPETFCLDPARVRAALTDRTRAILAVNLFGHPAPLRELRALADERGLALVEDNAQAPLASEHDRYAGTIGHIGVFSLNFHKHFHTGEGGVCTTDDEDLAERLRMIRNHGENVVSDLRPEDLSNLVGFNFRLSEVSAAIGREQLRKAERLVAGRVAIAERLTRGIAGLPGVAPPEARAGCRHVYYVWAARFDERRVGVSRETFARALAAEGVPVSQGYVEPLYLLPVFQRRIAIGRDGWPFSLTARTYPRGLCPVAERMHEKEVLEFFVCSYSPTEAQLGAIVDAFHKVHEHRRDLAPLAVPCPS